MDRIGLQVRRRLNWPVVLTGRTLRNAGSCCCCCSQAWETALAPVRKVGRAAISGVVIAFACVALLGMLLPETLLPDPNKRLLTALFLHRIVNLVDQDSRSGRARDGLHGKS